MVFLTTGLKRFRLMQDNCTAPGSGGAVYWVKRQLTFSPVDGQYPNAWSLFRQYSN
jgi:hypothetical protein